MANHTNYFRKFAEGLCLSPIDVGPNAKTETGITTNGALWIYSNKLRAYINGGVKEFLMIPNGYTLDFTIEDANSTITMDNANLEIESSDASQRTFKITSAKAGNTTLTLEENLTISDGYDISIVAEDASATITYDNVNFEVENTDGTQRTVKITSAKAGNTTVTLEENLNIGDGYDVTITAEDAAGAIVLDNCGFEVEDTVGSGNTFKLINATSDASRTITMSENLVIGDGYDITLTAEDAAGSITLDNSLLEVENTDGTQRTFKITSAKAGNTTVTLEENLNIGDGYDVTITAEDAAGAIVLDNCGFEVEDTVGSGNAFKLINATSDASRSITMSENLVIGDGADVTITAEDAAGSITLDNASFEVEDTVGSGNSFKLINATSDESRTITMSENLVIGDGYDITLTSEDATGAIVLDNANFEVENTDGTQRNFKITSAKAGNTTITLEEDFSIGDGSAVTITAEDAAGSITLDNASFEVEDTVGSGNSFKLINATSDASRSITMSENLVIGDGYDVTLQAEDAASTFLMDNAHFEVENTDGTQRSVKLTSAKAGNTTITLQEDFTINDGYDFSVTCEDAASAIVLDNANFEVENTNGTQRSFKITSAKAGNTTITLEEDFSIGDGGNVTITAEDAAGSITLDNMSFEVEDTVGSGKTIKIINASTDASKSITIEADSIINQDLSSDADVNFGTVTCVTDIDTPLVTNDSADLTISTTTSGNVNLNSVDNTVVISSGADTSATTNTVKFGDDTGGITGIRNNSGSMEFQDAGGGWNSLASGIGASSALDNLASVSINTSLISDTDSTDDLGSAAISWANTYTDSLHIEAGVEVLPTNHELTSADFLNSTTLRGWHNDGAADYDDNDWIGSKTLTENGTGLTSSTNHLGATAYCNFNGTDDYLSSTDAVFDTTDSFRCGAWIKPDDLSGVQDIISKTDNDNAAQKSFILTLNNTILQFYVFYNAAGGVVSARVYDVTELLDGNYHYVEAIYNQTDTSITLMIDGECRAEKIDANLSARNNDTDGVFTVGARYAAGGTSQFFDGDITEIFYQDITDDTANFINASRKTYAAGCGKLIAEDSNDNVDVIKNNSEKGKIFAKAYRNAAWNHTAGSGVIEIVPFDTVVRDEFGGFNTTTGVYTFDRQGAFQVCGSVRFSSIADGAKAYAGLYHNTTALYWQSEQANGATAAATASSQGLIFAVSGDTVALRVSQTNSASEAISTGELYSYITIAQLSD